MSTYKKCFHKRGFTKRLSLMVLLICLSGVVWAESMPTTCNEDCPAPYVENQFWTTEYGTASANIILHETNFLACSSSTYALCYYSGPDAAPSGTLKQPLPSLPCKVSKENSKLADCRCYVEAGDSYVDIHSIRNTEAYIETVRACGLNGEKCSNLISTAADKATALTGKTPTPLPTAPVCAYLQA
ncbi:MAG: hypothetical protein JKX81_08660, partial [Arenicella sp.]|nr:hypothetical protein [Arenicella sp.]